MTIYEQIDYKPTNHWQENLTNLTPHRSTKENDKLGKQQNKESDK